MANVGRFPPIELRLFGIGGGGIRMLISSTLYRELLSEGDERVISWANETAGRGFLSSFESNNS